MLPLFGNYLFLGDAMLRSSKNFLLAATFLIGTGTLAFSSSSASAAAVCLGNCGFLNAADGVVSLSPQGGQYGYVSTNGGVSGAGQIASVGGTNGSQYSTDSFTAKVGDDLKFYFNYVTSDGASFADYAWAYLSPVGAGTSGYLFTARTEPAGNTSPGEGLPANISTLTPASSAIIGGAPHFSPLGTSSGKCYDTGCGYTGWIQSDYTIKTAGDYVLTYGVTNFKDSLYDSALAFDGATIAGTPIGGGGGMSPVPLPASFPMFGGALLALGALGYGMNRKAQSKRTTASI